MKFLTTFMKKISFGIGILGLISLAVMMFLTTADVVARFVLGKGLVGTIEIMSFSFSVLLFSGLAYCQTRHGHIHITLIATKLPGKWKYVVWSIASLISATTGFLVTVASFMQAGIARQIAEHSMLLWIPYYPFYYFGAVCFGAFSICLLLDCVKSFLAIFKPKYAEEVSSTW
ncbi:MAG: TRAP transporter small permease [Clostridiales Family XIII bacterium]|jgi:TRAP-type C4-dicarboxylate transport system permease small subunit|nr:TRAP transporter small permease [Clostridiales Family XIII bacterium]